MLEEIITINWFPIPQRGAGGRGRSPWDSPHPAGLPSVIEFLHDLAEPKTQRDPPTSAGPYQDLIKIDIKNTLPKQPPKFSKCAEKQRQRDPKNPAKNQRDLKKCLPEGNAWRASNKSMEMLHFVPPRDLQNVLPVYSYGRFQLLRPGFKMPLK